MENQFTSKSIEELCNTDISRLSPTEMNSFHQELVIRKENLEEKLIILGVNPDILSTGSTRQVLKLAALQLSNVDNTLSHVKR